MKDLCKTSHETVMHDGFPRVSPFESLNRTWGVA